MVYDRVVDAIAGSLDIDREKLSLKTNIIDDLSADSLDLVEIISSLEDEFGIRVDENEIGSVKTVEDIVRLIEATM